MAKETPADKKSGVGKCPECGGALERVRRTVFMHALIGSKRYHCWHCRQDYLHFLGHFFRL